MGSISNVLQADLFRVTLMNKAEHNLQPFLLLLEHSGRLFGSHCQIRNKGKP
ncbi:hypothetical protein D3C73_1445120 [compost metagenome]